MSFSEVIMFVAVGFVFGVATYIFVTGGGCCGSCWIALFRGKRYETGCNDCILACYNQHTTEMEKAIDD